jgi:membrane-associated phospholipid phosphatase
MKLFILKIFPIHAGDYSTNWKQAWSSSGFRFQSILTCLILISVVSLIPGFFNYIQSRPGRQISDLLLNRIPARDVSWFIFSLLYSILFITLVNLSYRPVLLLKGLQAYCLLLLLRICTLLLFPLEPEQNIVPLQDPFIGRFFYGNSVITKDLFFSGHVSTLFLVFLLNPIKQLSPVFLGATLLLSSLILLQHVHYSADVIAAPVFAWISYKLADYLAKKPMQMKPQSNLPAS